MRQIRRKNRMASFDFDIFEEVKKFATIKNFNQALFGMFDPTKKNYPVPAEKKKEKKLYRLNIL